MSMKILVYDLPSENQKHISANHLYEKVRNLRVNCVRLLHSLGIQCTESVIIISPIHYNKIDEIVNKVNSSYTNFEAENNITLGRPLIRVLELTQEQAQTFLELAKKGLVERLDYSIEVISKILDELDNIVSQNKAENTLRNLRRLRREWNNIRELAESLGIDVSRDYEYLISLIDKAIDELRGAER